MKIQRWYTNAEPEYLVPDDNGPFYKVEDVQPFLEPRPISEAPKDGTPILAVGTNAYADDIHWFTCMWHEHAWWANDYCGGGARMTPTHFLPLPPVGEQG